MSSVYIVYITYLYTVERIYAYHTEESAKASCLEHMWEYVHGDSFHEYLEAQNISPDSVTVSTFWDYYREVEDDSYVTYELVQLQP